jgi:hypothetical protein
VQLRALALLRWQMIRTPGVRLSLAFAAVVVVYLLESVTTSAALLSAPALSASVELAPAAFLGFGVLAVVAPLTAGGGLELVPSDQLVAYPVRPATQFLGGLLLAPVNLVWLVQLLVLAAETAYLTLDRSRFTGVLTTTAFVICLTVVGQAIAWTVVGLRQSRGGRRAVTATTLLVLAFIVGIVRLRAGVSVLRMSPTHLVVRAIEDGPNTRWALTTVALMVGSALGLVGGFRACSWALRRPADGGRTAADRELRRRPGHRTALTELLALDRASVWRAPALRRGGLVLALLPSLVALGGAIPWQTLIVLPGLVTAGAGLLFGVNAFCLDGSGALWLASLPYNPALAARSKLIVLSETVAAGAVLALLTGSLRSPGSPTGTEVVAMAASSVACAILVVATCMSLSVLRPHRADLRGPRDAVAPPGALAAASARLALPAAFVGIVLEGLSGLGIWWVPLLVAAPVIAASVLWLRRSMARYADPLVRARIVQIVSAG